MTEKNTMLHIMGRRRPNRSANNPKTNAPTGRNASVTVIASVIFAIVTPNESAAFDKTNTRTKKSNASNVHPRKLAMTVFRRSLSHEEEGMSSLFNATAWRKQSSLKKPAQRHWQQS
jgi:hypothetical protein